MYLYLLSQTTGHQTCPVRSFPGISSKGGKGSVFHPSLGLFYFFRWILEDLNHLPVREFRVINLLANTRNISRKTNISFRTNSFSKRTCWTTSESGSITRGLQSDCHQQGVAVTAPESFQGESTQIWAAGDEWLPGFIPAGMKKQQDLEGRGWICMCIGMYGMYVYRCMCMHTYVYVCVYMYMYIHTYTQRIFFSSPPYASVICRNFLWPSCLAEV